MTREQQIAELLRSYGGAMRGDWSMHFFDGRDVRRHLEALADALEGKRAIPTRAALNLCEHGSDQWDGWCDNDCGGDR